MSKIKKDLKHIHKNHLSVKIQNAIDKNGFSIYKGVLIVWGKLQDEKLLELIDTVAGEYPDRLLLVHFEDNFLEMLWKDEVPPGFLHAVTDTELGRIEMQPNVWIVPVIFD